MPRTRPKKQTQPTITRDEYEKLLAESRRLKETGEQLSAEYKRLKEKPQPLTPEQQRKQASERRFAALEEIVGLLDDISSCALDDLVTFKLILDRDRGAFTPIEEFITHLVLVYRVREDEGRGMTIEDIESDFDELRADMPRLVEQARFLANRHPRTEPKTEVNKGVN